jgi:fatty acid desaturase
MTTTLRTAPPVTAATAPRGSDYARLSRRVAEAGLMRRRPGHYAFRLTAVTGALAGTWWAFLTLGTSWWQLAVAGCLGLVCGQVALVAHDLAHRQVFRGRRSSETGGRLAGNLGIGMSYGWWRDKHTRHHARPNHEELDPDVAPDILVWSRRQARAARGVARFVGRHQAALFFPLLTLEGFHLHVASLRALRRAGVRRRVLEGTLLVLHLTGYLAAVFTVLPFGTALAFVCVHQAVFGVYLGCIFAPNHKGMPTVTGPEPDFLRRQVLTSRNVRGGRFMDIALGGLNHQIEHHLFPSMPAPNLRKARVLVREHCTQAGIPYHETSLVRSWQEALRHLHDVGVPIRGGASAS